MLGNSKVDIKFLLRYEISASITYTVWGGQIKLVAWLKLQSTLEQAFQENECTVNEHVFMSSISLDKN